MICRPAVQINHGDDRAVETYRQSTQYSSSSTYDGGMTLRCERFSTVLDVTRSCSYLRRSLLALQPLVLCPTAIFGPPAINVIAVTTDRFSRRG